MQYIYCFYSFIRKQFKFFNFWKKRIEIIDNMLKKVYDSSVFVQTRTVFFGKSLRERKKALLLIKKNKDTRAEKKENAPAEVFSNSKDERLKEFLSKLL